MPNRHKLYGLATLTAAKIDNFHFSDPENSKIGFIQEGFHSALLLHPLKSNCLRVYHHQDVKYLLKCGLATLKHILQDLF